MNDLSNLDQHRIKHLSVFAIFVMGIGIISSLLLKDIDLNPAELLTDAYFLIPIPIFLWNFKNEQLPFFKTLIVIAIYNLFISIIINFSIISPNDILDLVGNIFSLSYFLSLLLEYLILEGLHKLTWMIVNDIAIFNVFFYIIVSYILFFFGLEIFLYNPFYFIPLLVIPRFFESLSTREENENLGIHCLKNTGIIFAIVLIVLFVACFNNWLELSNTYAEYGISYSLADAMKVLFDFDTLKYLLLFVSYLTVPDLISSALTKPIVAASNKIKQNQLLIFLVYIGLFYAGLIVYNEIVSKFIDVDILRLLSFF